jgi:hypothetical protein
LNELETEWKERLEEAHRRARAQGRGDVADYLFLRAENDMARTTGVEWLFETFTSLAGEVNRGGASLDLTRDEAHRFPLGNSTMVGSRLTLRAGIRTLTVEAGWPRAPRDGIVRGGGLAQARISHFGNRAAGEDLLLLRAEGGAPKWFALEQTGERAEFLEERVRRHMTKLLQA